jgi:predicted nucleic acid-binding protein
VDRVYLETSFIGYLASDPSRDVTTWVHQQASREWWETRQRFELFISEVVERELSAGNPALAAKRMAAVDDLQRLELTTDALELARQLIESGPIPRKAELDALHIALATVHGMDYLLTWNCKHIANAAMQRKIAAVCRSEGFEPPVICTPEELMPE